VTHYRKRLPSAILRLMLASGFAIAATHRMWRMWWFDVVRDSGPPLSYIFTTIVPFAAVFAIVGWLLARYITPSLHIASNCVGPAGLPHFLIQVATLELTSG
jgi:hypothetical protein